MRRVVLLLLAALTALNGCANPLAHQTNPQSEHQIGPTLTRVPEPATYALTPLEHPNAVPLATVHLNRGERVGFRRDSDGTLVAVAGKQTFPVPNGTFGWVIVEKPTPGLHEKNEQTTEAIDETKLIIYTTAGVVILCCLGLVALWWYLRHGDSSSS